MKVFVENNKVKFTQGAQTFTIDYDGNEDELNWMVEQLENAFIEFINSKTK